MPTDITGFWAIGPDPTGADVKATVPDDGEDADGASLAAMVQPVINVQLALTNKLCQTTVTRKLVVPVSQWASNSHPSFDDEPSGGNIQLSSDVSSPETGLACVKLPRGSTITALEILCANKEGGSKNLAVSAAKYVDTPDVASDSGLLRTSIASSVSVAVPAGSGTNNWAWRAATLTSPGSMTEEDFLMVYVIVPATSGGANYIHVAALRVTYTHKGIDVG